MTSASPSASFPRFPRFLRFCVATATALALLGCSSGGKAEPMLQAQPAPALTAVLAANAPTANAPTAPAHDPLAAHNALAAVLAANAAAASPTAPAHDAVAEALAAAASPSFSLPTPSSPPPPALAAPVGDCHPDDAPFAPTILARDLAFLAAPALDGRKSGTPGDVAARRFLAARLRCLGLIPAGDLEPIPAAATVNARAAAPATSATTAAAPTLGYEQAFSIPLPAAAAVAAPAATATTATTANLVAYLPGTDAAVAAEQILVTAHHDHLGDGHLGANDNASGAAALLAVAQSLATAGPRRRTVAFVLFGAEEQGLLGSQHYLAHPPAALPLARAVQVINLDMIGSYASKRRVHAFGAAAGLPATALLAELDDAFPRTRVAIGGHSVRGDHHGFCALGVPYVFFWTSDARCYHRRCDTADRVDLPRLADIAALAGALTSRLADSPLDLAAVRASRGCTVR